MTDHDFDRTVDYAAEARALINAFNAEAESGGGVAPRKRAARKPPRIVWQFMLPPDESS